MTTEEVIRLNQVLARLLQLDAVHRLVLGGLLRLQLARAAREAASVSDDFDQAQNGLIRQYGEPIENGTKYRVSAGPNLDKFNAEIEAILKATASVAIVLPKLSQTDVEKNGVLDLKLLGDLDALGLIEWNAP